MKNKSVGIRNQRNYANTCENHRLNGVKHMTQAATLTEKQLKKVLIYISYNKHSVRNRTMVLMTFYSGMRVGEIANLLIGDVLADDGSIKEEIHLKAEQTKGNNTRTVMLPSKLIKEIDAYLKERFTEKELIALAYTDKQLPLFYTQKRNGFTANTLTQFFHSLYKNAGIDGASSHSGRRTFITNLAHKGIGVRVLMGLAGHRNLSTTQRYIDCNEEVMRAAVELI